MRSPTYGIQELKWYLEQGPVDCMVVEGGMTEPQFFKENLKKLRNERDKQLRTDIKQVIGKEVTKDWMDGHKGKFTGKCSEDENQTRNQRQS